MDRLPLLDINLVLGLLRMVLDDLITILKTLREATNKGDMFSIEKYYIVRDEAALESPYDPDFESEEYYEHQERLSDENYAKKNLRKNDGEQKEA